MEPYVRALLARLSSLRKEYEAAAEIAAKATIEYRECRRGWMVIEAERDCIQQLLEYWSASPALPFACKEELDTALAAVKQIRRREGTCQ